MTVATKERGIVFTAESVRAILEGRKHQSRRVMREQPTQFTEDGGWWESADGSGRVGATYEFSGSRPARWFLFDDDLVNGRIEYMRPAVGERPTKRQALAAARWSGQFGRKPKWAESEVVGLCPYGKPGDVLYAKEVWGIGENWGRLVDPCLNYKADGAQVPLIEHEGGWSIQGKFACWGDELARIKDGWRSPRFMPKWASRLRLRLTDVGVERVNEISEADAQAEGVERLELTSGILEDVPPPFNRVHPLTSTYVEAFKASWDAINKARGYPFDSGAFVWKLAFERLEEA